MNMKEELEQSRKIIMGYVLEANKHKDAGEKSYDDMRGVGYVRIHDRPFPESGDDLNDAPFDCNGSIYSGNEIELEKGDVIIIIKK